MGDGAKGGIAVQLYSIHQYIAKEGLGKALEEVAKIGYAGVEFAGYWDHDASQIKSMLDNNGLAACGVHRNRERFIGDALKENCDFATSFGSNYLVCPGGGHAVPEDWDKPKDDWWKYLTEFYAKAAVEAAKYGCSLGLHNHAWEFQTKLDDGTLMWDYFFKNTPDTVFMEQDVGWTTYAGFDPCLEFSKYPHRSPTLHAKENGMDAPDFDAVLGRPGSGAKGVDWQRLAPAADANGVKWWVVECERHFDSLDAVRPSFEFLRSIGR